MNSAEIRRRFIEYYKRLGFLLLPRAPLLHPSIPMSFVMSAGLAQVETALAQSYQRPGDRFVLIQDCFRHFDLDKVGTDDIHLSLFEMPGAFMFGPIDKKETIRQMWTLATSVLGIDRSRIWASYFRGGKVLNNNLPPDEVTHQTWLEMGLGEDRIVGLGEDVNYWLQGNGIDGMGTLRKAGPNTELFYDRGPEKACGANCQPGCRCGRFVEFSNSLFICYEVDPETEKFYPMEEPFTETVIGTERVAMILQSVPSVFETDRYQVILEAIRHFVRNPNLPDPIVVEAERVLADHLRALYFLAADGAPPPGKNGRERIMKLLIRRAATRQAILGIQDPAFLPRLVECISESAPNNGLTMHEVKERLASYFATETERFWKSVERGYRQLERFLKENNGQTLTGLQIVRLEKEWGLPPILVAISLREKGLPFAEAEYKEALEVWKQTPHHQKVDFSSAVSPDAML